MSDAARLILLAAIGGGAAYWWRASRIAALGHAPDPGVADGLAFIPYPLPGGVPPMGLESAPHPTSGPRGIRNHNPGNIRDTGDPWVGVTGSDGAFEVFSAPVYGLRALAKILLGYQSRYGLSTVAQLINRWAPPVENDTGAYVDAVARELGVSASTGVDLRASPAFLANLVAAIVRHENGQQPYAADLIARAVAMAL